LHSEGIYNETLLSVSGCDSVLVLYLSVLPKGKCPEIEIPLFFSPNGDGLNDVWKIKGIECYEHKVYLYDRFSKELFVWENNFPIEGWNGMYLDKPMPSTDYWYLVVLEGRDFVGHFTLLR
jgi:gliding motility-associated-like protein